MRLEHYPLEKLKKEILEIIGRYADLATHRVFFFGSRVEGTSDERSDIDIGIEGPAPLSQETYMRITDAIKNIATLYKIDVVDFKNVEDDFRAVALRHTEPILSGAQKSL